MTISIKEAAAVVVTYNRLALLQTCIQALRSQTQPLSGIIVVNNSSTDGTGAWLLAQPDITTITQPNLGGAAGFYTGIKTAVEQGYQWAWCMDDDGKPDAKAIERLLQFKADAPCVMNALVLDEQKPGNLVFAVNGYTRQDQIKERKIEHGAAFFNGTLIHRGVVEKVGLPLKQLTIWGDETEYYNRIRFKHGFPIFTVSDSYHYHPAQYNVFYKREWDVAKDWKVYYYIRNKSFVYASQYQNPVRGTVAYLTFVAGFAGTIFAYQRQNRWKKLKLLAVAAKHGLSQKTDMAIDGARKLLAQL